MLESLNDYKALINRVMIDKQLIQDLVDAKLQATSYELITLKVSAQNELLV